MCLPFASGMVEVFMKIIEALHGHEAKHLPVEAKYYPRPVEVKYCSVVEPRNIRPLTQNIIRLRQNIIRGKTLFVR